VGRSREEAETRDEQSVSPVASHYLEKLNTTDTHGQEIQELVSEFVEMVGLERDLLQDSMSQFFYFYCPFVEH